MRKMPSTSRHLVLSAINKIEDRTTYNTNLRLDTTIAVQLTTVAKALGLSMNRYIVKCIIKGLNQDYPKARDILKLEIEEMKTPLNFE